VRLVQCDVTALQAAAFGTGFQFVLDFGCFHGLTDAQRAAMGREVTAVTGPEATMLMIAWATGRRWPLRAGRADIEGVFPEWTVVNVDALPYPHCQGR
jgi:hypothetical protein